jgi:hypothetical protein
MQEASERMRDEVATLMNTMVPKNPVWRPKVSIEMPRYFTMKTVSALKIKAVNNVVAGHNKGGGVLEFEDVRYAPRQVDPENMAEYKPKAGDYFVIYSDGREFFFSAEAFESIYIRASDFPRINASVLDEIDKQCDAVLAGMMMVSPDLLKQMVALLRKVVDPMQ